MRVPDQVNDRHVIARIPEVPPPRVEVVARRRSVMVRGYTKPLRELLRKRGFRYFMGNRAWILQPLSEEEVEEIINELLRIAEERGVKVEVRKL